MTLAGRELAVTPGAVSRLIRALEEDLKAPLFVRRAGGLELTPVGRTMAEGAREALDRLHEATTGVRMRRPRRLSIGVYGHFLSRALLPRLPDLSVNLPSLAIDVHTSTNALDLLPTRFDAVIAVSGPGPQTGLVIRPLMPIVTVAVVAPQRLQSGPIDFAQIPMLHTRPRSEDWRRWLDFAGFKTIAVRGGSSFESASQTLEATAADLGAAIAIEGLLQPDLASGRLAIAHPARRPTTRHFTLQYEARLKDDPSLTAFSEWLCRQFEA